MHLNLFVSQKCFLYCKGCYSFSRTEKCGQIISSDIIIEFLNFVYKNGINKVTLCGGDPLTRNDILSLLSEIKNIGFAISLDTVGTSIIRDIKKDGESIFNKTPAKEIVRFVDIIGIPIDGSTNAIFKLFRQSNFDLLNEQIKICEELHNYGAKICINTVVHKGNLNDAIALSNLIKKLDYIEKWQIFQYAPLGKYGILNRNLFEITEREFNEFKMNVLNNFDDKSKIQFKGFKERNNLYMLIDNSGNAWIPLYDKNKFNDDCLQIEKRQFVGNINNSNDWNKIINYLKKNI